MGKVADFLRGGPEIDWEGARSWQKARDEKLREDIQGWFDRECHWLAFGAGYSGNEEGSAVLCISGLDAIYELAKIIRGET